VVCERRCSPQQLLVEILSCSKSLFISCCWNAHNMPKYQQDRSHSISIKSQSISIQFPWTKTIQSHWIGTIRSPAEVVEAPPELWAMLQVGHGDGFFQWNLYELIRISWEICDFFFFKKIPGITVMWIWWDLMGNYRLVIENSYRKSPVWTGKSSN
jgi:hypothetical protein